MKRIREETRRGRENWESLSANEQFAACARVADVLNRTGEFAAISPDATGAGVGVRERHHGKYTRLRHDKPVVTIRVPRKRSPKSCGKRLVPARLQMEVMVSGRRRVLSVPTDVRVDAPVPVAQADPYKVNMQSTIMSSPPADGSLCALVRNRYGNQDIRYVLTCHHVAFLSLLNRSLAPDTSAIAFHQSGRAITTAMGKPSRMAPFGPGEPVSIDAALIRLMPDSPALHSGFWPARVIQAVTTIDQVHVAFDVGCGVYNRRLQGTVTTLSDIRYNHSVRYDPGGATVYIPQLIEYRINGQSGTAPGDSGGALITSNGLLVGMHIAGVNDHGYAIPAYLLFSTIAFNPPLELAQP